MKVGDLVEVFRHIPRYESGEIPVGKMGVGVIVDIKELDVEFPETVPNTVVSYVSSQTGNVESEWVGEIRSGIVVTMRVIDVDKVG